MKTDFLKVCHIVGRSKEMPQYLLFGPAMKTSWVERDSRLSCGSHQTFFTMTEKASEL